MLFNSALFFVFFAAVLAIRFARPVHWTLRKVLLLLASYAFYTAWYPPHLLILLTSTVVDWHVAQGIHRTQNQRRKRALLLISLCINLGVLAVFKYSGFAIENVNHFLHTLGLNTSIPLVSLVLPVGISFYTFEALSYTIEVYRGKMKPADSFLDFALFITFFPRMVAGPIMRAEAFLPQLVRDTRVSIDQFFWGLSLLVFGLFQKIVLADTLFAPTSDLVFSQQRPLQMLDAWVGTLAFAWQILFDFAGYSTCAIGIALCLGFVLPANFRTPYAARSFSDFWRRWHISLSSWLRDYLYISLGGNRKGPVRTYVNLFLTMVLGGLWHGAAWTFIVWGVLHGLYLAIERRLDGPTPAEASARTGPGTIVRVLLTFAAVCFAWVFFRAQSVSTAVSLVRSMVGAAPAGAARIVGIARVVGIIGATAVLLLGQWRIREQSLEDAWKRIPIPLRVAILTVGIFLLLTSPGDDRAFIYFQF